MSRVEAAAFVVHTVRFDESVRFYRDVLGLELVEEWTEGGHGAVIRLGPQLDLELIELDGSEHGHGAVALGLEVDDVDAWYARILDRGGRAKAPPVDAFGKRGFGTTDPNGVPVNIYTSGERSAQGHP
jgi:catechol 2,3-dioxygenase-like lactoylglutathione lyase family enzyme